MWWLSLAYRVEIALPTGEIPQGHFSTLRFYKSSQDVITHRSMTSMIYKIVSRALWAEADAVGRFDGAPVDLLDGFIHFSTAGQVAETAARHFGGQLDLLLVAVDPARLGAALRWEPSRGGALFPHLYAPLAVADAAWAKPLPLAGDGRHDFEDLVP